MKWFEAIPQSLKELRKLAREFRKSPVTAAKALIIFAIIAVTMITQVSGYRQSVSYVWMIGGLILIIVILFATLRMARSFDRQMA